MRKGATVGIIVSIFLVLVATFQEIHKCYKVREWSQRRKDELKKPGCEVCGCVLWWDMSEAKKYDFKYNFSSSLSLIVLSLLKLAGTTANAAQVNAILTILSTPCEFYDWWLLDFKSLDDDTNESDTISTRRVVIGKIIGIIVAFVYLVYDTATSALSDGSVIGVVAVAFILNFVLLCLEAYTLRHTRARILQQEQMGQLAPLSGFLGSESVCSGARPPHPSSLFPSFTLSHTPLTLLHKHKHTHTNTRTQTFVQVVHSFLLRSTMFCNSSRWGMRDLRVNDGAGGTCGSTIKVMVDRRVHHFDCPASVSSKIFLNRSRWDQILVNDPAFAWGNGVGGN